MSYVSPPRTKSSSIACRPIRCDQKDFCPTISLVTKITKNSFLCSPASKGTKEIIERGNLLIVSLSFSNVENRFFKY